jgi:hypothetical protein
LNNDVKSSRFGTSRVILAETEKWYHLIFHYDFIECSALPYEVSRTEQHRFFLVCQSKCYATRTQNSKALDSPPIELHKPKCLDMEKLD